MSGGKCAQNNCKTKLQTNNTVVKLQFIITHNAVKVYLSVSSREFHYNSIRLLCQSCNNFCIALCVQDDHENIFPICRLIMNDCLNSGTQLPFIKRAIESGYGVLVLNTNENTRGDGADKVIIRVRALQILIFC